MDRQIQRVDYVIMICTPLHFKRVMGEEKQGVGLGGIWESVVFSCRGIARFTTLRVLMFQNSALGTFYIINTLILL